MSDKKTIIIRFRVDEKIHKEMQTKADEYFNGNLSALIRCAVLGYSETETNNLESPQMIALLNSSLKIIGRIGTNSNQIIKHINEQQKMFPLSIRASDILPLSRFHDDWVTIQDMLKYLYNLIAISK
ncbi:hypothetical protein [uncultured Duncaniella sp.]|uniref:hypothetical protein n=1 Tax=uncultured Duncaniella sp. TaxID=2768039 RepID=UPI00263ABA90|nr:hypothetical protein [uncultured Duncaniella sp.]